jgi:hypothetical protein
MLNVRKHTIRVFEDIIVPKAQNPIAMRFEQLGALGITVGAWPVLAAIDFNDHLGFVAGKVRDIAADLNLSAKMRARFREPVAQVPPQSLFGVRWIRTHRARVSTLRRRQGAIAQCPGAGFAM